VFGCRLALVLALTLASAACADERREVSEEPPPASPTAEPVGRAAELVRVVDGDTIRVRFEGREERVRYIGIDTPEIAHGDGEVSEPFGDAATEANRRVLRTGALRLVFDVEERDRYGRLLAYVYAGDTMVNEALLREGFAQVLTVPPNVRHAERFRGIQREARAAGRGLWAE